MGSHSSTFVKRDGWETNDILQSASPLALLHKVYFHCVNSVIWFVFHSVVYRSTYWPQKWCHCIWSGVHGPSFHPEVFGVYVFGFGACRILFDVSLTHFVARLMSQLKHILGLADQCAHASTFEGVGFWSKICCFVFLTVYRSPLLGACNFHNKPAMQRHVFQTSLFLDIFPAK